MYSLYIQPYKKINLYSGSMLPYWQKYIEHPWECYLCYVLVYLLLSKHICQLCYQSIATASTFNLQPLFCAGFIYLLCKRQLCCVKVFQLHSSYYIRFYCTQAFNLQPLFFSSFEEQTSSSVWHNASGNIYIENDFKCQWDALYWLPCLPLTGIMYTACK